MTWKGLLVVGLAALIAACGSPVVSTSRSDLAHARLEGAYDVTYKLLFVGNAAGNGFGNSFGHAGDAGSRVWEMTPTCPSGPCDTLSPVGWFPDGDSVYYATDFFKFAGGVYTDSYENKGWECLPQAQSDAFTETVTIKLTPTRAQQIAGEFVVTDFSAIRIAKYTPSADAAASGCTPFEGHWQLVGSRYSWK